MFWHNDPIVLLDEPALGLDVHNAITGIQALARRFGKTAAPETEVRPWAVQAWPNAILHADRPITTISFPASHKVQCAEVAFTIAPWSLDVPVLAIKQAVSSLEDAAIHLINNTNSHV